MVHTKNPSPAWRNPGETAKRYSLKRKSCKLEPKKPAVSNLSFQSPTKSRLSPTKGSPRKTNPFSKLKTTPCKKRKLEELSPRKMTLRSAEKRFCPDSPKSTKSGRLLDLSSSSYCPLDFSSLSDGRSSLNVSKKQELPPLRKVTEIPMDLRPGTKIKIVSKKPFPWMTQNRATMSTAVLIPKADLIAGRRAVCGVDLEQDPNKFTEGLSPMAKLQAASQYYQFPDLAFLKLASFPRHEAHSRMTAACKTHSLQQLGMGYVDNLIVQWKQTFEEIYDDWKRGSRRSFYLFGHHMSVFFTKYVNLPSSSETQGSGDSQICADETVWTLNGKNRHRVIITPTTSGLRQMLRDEGIKFELPLSGKRKKRRSSNNGQSVMGNDDTLHGFDRSDVDKENAQSMPIFTINSTENKSPEKSGMPVDDLLESPGNGEGAMDHDEWLKDIGISPRSTLGFGRHATIADFSLHTTMSNMASDDVDKGLDASFTSEAAKSTAVITDPQSIHGFFNFMMTSKEFRATVGVQAGLPPTIVAFDAFNNCTSKCLQKTSQISKHGQKMEFVVEMEGGPILPNVPEMLISFIQSIPSLNVKDNKMKITIAGRHPYLGFNEAVDGDSLKNNTEFWFDPVENVFEV